MAIADSTSTQLSRREFIRFGGLGALGMRVADGAIAPAAAASGAKSCITIYLNGGPSQFETFDPKPEAPLHSRGPYRGIATQIPGMRICETLPLLAQRAGRFSLLRSLWHDAAPIHETGQQLLQSGRLAQRGIAPPSLGALIAQRAGATSKKPAYVVMPDIARQTGVYATQSQLEGDLGASCRPLCLNPADLSRMTGVGFRGLAPSVDELCRYGKSPFAMSCLAARKLVEQGVRFVGINMFPNLTGHATWDCHGNERFAPATLRNYRETICPDFDRACASLLDDLDEQGLLPETLVVAAGEFGRSPRINNAGGRDHWNGVWSALIAGGGIGGGQVIGASDKRGAYPADRPIPLAELAATVLKATGFDLSKPQRSSNGSEIVLTDASPIHELWG